MNMSEDVTAVSMQVSEKAAEAALAGFKSVLDSVGRLFRELLGMEHDRARAKAQIKASKSSGQGADKGKQRELTSTNLTSIKPGEVSLKDLAENARSTGESLSVSQHGFSQEDRKAIARAAKKYGIPVAFSNTKGKNNLYANVRSGDLPIFKQICTECIREKIAEKPETLGNFKVQPWEVPHLTAMLKAHDLPAVFVETKNGEQYCLHDVKHADAVRIVREEFVAKCKEIEKQFSFDCDEAGFYTLKDLHSGKEISFDQVPDKATLSRQIQAQFGYDSVKADLAAAKFAEESLQGKEKQQFFSGSAQQEFSRIEANVTLEGEIVYAKPYSCWYVQPKKDEKPRVVFRDHDGSFAILEPQKMSRKSMREVLTVQLGITDRRTLDALTDKADRVADFYARQDTALLSADRTFKMEDFETDKIVEHKYTGASGMEYVTKQKPLDSVENSIKRTGTDSFTVKTVFRSTDITDKGDSVPHEKTEHLDFTLSDNKRTLHFLSAMYMDAGMSEADAKAMAKEVYSKAAAQSPETVVRIEEVTRDSMTVAYGKASVVLSTADRQDAAEKIAGLGVSPQTAETLVDKAQEIRVDAIKERVAAVQAQQTDFNTAMNHLTDREERSIDSMIVCSAAEPQKHIVVEGGHNGSRVVHDYSVFNGSDLRAKFSDAETTNAEGKPVSGEDGKTAWTELKAEMLAASGMDKDAVLTFSSREEYEQYLTDTQMLRDADAMPIAESHTDMEKVDAQAPVTDHVADAPAAPSDAPAPADAKPIVTDTPPEPAAAPKPAWESYFQNPQFLSADRQFDGSHHLKKSQNGGNYILSDPLPDGTFYVMLNRQNFNGDSPFYEYGTEIINQFFSGAEEAGGQLTDMTPARVKPVPFHEGEFMVVERGTIQQAPYEADVSMAAGNGHEHHPDGDILQGLHDAKPDLPDIPNPAPRGARR